MNWIRKYFTVLLISLIIVSCVGVAAVMANIWFSFDINHDAISVESSERSNTVIQLVITTDGEEFEFVSELPDIEYLAGLTAVYDDYSTDAIFQSDAEWSSNNENVCVIFSNGSIRPTGIGAATITASYCGVKTEKEIIVSAGKISMIKTEPAELFTVISADRPDAVEIIGGNITALDVGEVTVRAEYAGLSDAVKINVEVINPNDDAIPFP